jgi:hypothetical protein
LLLSIRTKIFEDFAELLEKDFLILFGHSLTIGAV